MGLQLSEAAAGMFVGIALSCWMLKSRQSCMIQPPENGKHVLSRLYGGTSDKTTVCLCMPTLTPFHWQQSEFVTNTEWQVPLPLWWQPTEYW